MKALLMVLIAYSDPVSFFLARYTLSAKPPLPITLILSKSAKDRATSEGWVGDPGAVLDLDADFFGYFEKIAMRF